MKVLVATLYPNLGGSNRVLLAAARALASEHEVAIRAPLPEATHPSRGFGAEPLNGLGAKLRALPTLAARAARELAFVARLRPDVVYVHDELALYVYGPVARLLRIPVVWHAHQALGTGPKRRVRQALSDRRIAISRFGEGSRSVNVALIRNPLLSTPPGVAPSGGGGLDLVVIGAIGPRKNQALAIETLALVRERGHGARLTLIGAEIDPAYGRFLRDLAEALGVAGSVRFAGPLSPEEVWRDDAVALFPATYENQPLALIEALAGGRRVVAGEIPAHQEIFADVGADPRLLAALTPSAFADAVEAAVRAEPDEGLQKRVTALFARGRFEDEIRSFFREL